MLFNLIFLKNKRDRESGIGLFSSLGNGVPTPGTAFCGILTMLQTFLNTPESKTATITVTKTTTIT
jgi:hypothetical protein